MFWPKMSLKMENKKQDVKYVLELTEQQAHQLDHACEFYARICMGQWREIIYECLDVKREDYCEARDKAEKILFQARRVVWPELQLSGASWGIGHDDHADMIWELHEVLRNKIAWHEHPEGGDSVNFYPPCSLSDRPPAPCFVTSDIDGSTADLILQLRRLSVETGSLACLGCGHEHNCGISGCAIIRKAIDALALLDAKSKQEG